MYSFPKKSEILKFREIFKFCKSMSNYIFPEMYKSPLEIVKSEHLANKLYFLILQLTNFKVIYITCSLSAGLVDGFNSHQNFQK